MPGHMLRSGPACPSPAYLGLGASLGLLLLPIEGRLFMRPAQILVTSPCCPGHEADEERDASRFGTLPKDVSR